MRPEHSRPGTSDAPGGGGYIPWRCITSARLTAVAMTSTTTSFGPGSGSGCSVHSRTSGPPGSRMLIAYTTRDASGPRPQYPGRMAEQEPRWLDPVEWHAWRNYIAGQALLAGRLNRELSDAHGISLADYEILVRLSEQQDHRMRMSLLADEVVASKSRLSHQVSRLEADDLVRRELCPSDGRGVFAVLTAHGYDVLQRAAPDHLEGVRAHFVDLLDDHERRVIGDVFERVVTKLRADS
jgi:DNA-binding MarR family transcriptional regulator